MKNKSYIGISFVILIFGIYAIPKIIDRINNDGVSEETRMNKIADGAMSYLEIDGKAKKIPNFTFINQDSLTITNADYKDKVYVVEFFFTTCPSICPIMNRNMLKLEKEFGKRDDFGIASFTIDPKHDTPIVLKKYAEEYGVTSLNWHMLTNEDHEKVFELSNNGLNIFAEINPEVDGGFEHQGFFALVDKDGYLRSRKDEYGNPIVYYSGIEDDQIALLKADIIKLLEE